MTEQLLLEKLRQKDEVTIIRLYNEYKADFIGFLKRDFTSLDDDNLHDLYQEAWYAVYRNIKDGRLLKLTSTLKTYLFQIGRNQANTLIKKVSRNTDEKEIVDEQWENDIDETEDIQAAKASIVRQAVSMLTDVCRKIMKLFYFEGKKLDEILDLLDDFSSKDALKTKKYKCMKRLEKLVKDKFATDKIL